MSKQNLVRKQYLMSTENISKLDELAQQQGTSSAQIVRLAIDAYDPDNQITLEEEKELMELVSSRLKEAIEDTRATRKRLDKTLEQLGAA
jgi:predicted DNA-binding protein